MSLGHCGRISPKLDDGSHNHSCETQAYAGVQGCSFFELKVCW